MSQPLVAVKSVRLFERPIALRLPFKFGAVTLTHAPQVFVRIEAELDGQTVFGQAAELLAPKWFDKNPDLSNEDNFDQLRTSLRLAASLYMAAPEPDPAFALHAALQPAHYRSCAIHGLNGLIASFGTALIDRAIIDAICRHTGLSAEDNVKRNSLGITAHATPDLYGEDLSGFLAQRSIPETIAVRHTVGMADAITETDLTSRVGDGLPESLEAVIARYGHLFFKLKVGGNLTADIERLTQIAFVLDQRDEPYYVSLDGNEQYSDAEAVVELTSLIEQNPKLGRLWQSTLYIEQPIARAQALRQPVHAIAAKKPVAIDESDVNIGVFPIAKALGYQGISSKSCKGFYRALLNAARVGVWNREAGSEHFFMIAEDLTTQPGIAVQQDFTLAALIGASHVERNGHHYVDGFAGAPRAEQERFVTAHPDLYTMENGTARLKITDGTASLSSLKVAGLGTACEPDWSAMDEFDLGADA